jgi:hypothetical protein
VQVRSTARNRHGGRLPTKFRKLVDGLFDIRSSVQPIWKIAKYRVEWADDVAIECCRTTR